MTIQTGTPQTKLGLGLLILAALLYVASKWTAIPGEFAATVGMLGTLLIKAEFIGSKPASSDQDSDQKQPIVGK